MAAIGNLPEESARTFKEICKNLPHNRNRVYCRIFLENSKCIVYMPLRDNAVNEAEAAKSFYEKLANMAKL